MTSVTYTADWEQPLRETTSDEHVMAQVLINLVLSMLGNPTSEAALLAIVSQLLDLLKANPGTLAKLVETYKANG